MSSALTDWAAAGCHEAAPGVHRIPLSMPNDGLRAISVYAVETPDGLVLVDGGWRVPSAWRELEAALGSIGRRTAEVTDVYVTHVHRDHYTLALELRRRHGTRVHLGRDERPGLTAVRALGTNVPESSLRELARAGAGEMVGPVTTQTLAEPFDAEDWADPDQWLDAGPLDLGDRVLEVVPTPGHTKGHVVLHDRASGLLFTGDHVLPSITPSIGFELGEWELPLGRYLASLALLLERPDATMMPAHGHHGGSVHARVRDLLAHHERRFAEVLAAVEAVDGPVHGYDVAARLLWTRRGRPFVGLDDFNKMIAVCETLAHLDVLVERGVLAVDGDRAPLDVFVRAA
jgi:glyoxylase-like metal-dependent hydrolase (beta-lactamase superfamily II)